MYAFDVAGTGTARTPSGSLSCSPFQFDFLSIDPIHDGGLQLGRVSKSTIRNQVERPQSELGLPKSDIPRSAQFRSISSKCVQSILLSNRAIDVGCQWLPFLVLITASFSAEATSLKLAETPKPNLSISFKVVLANSTASIRFCLASSFPFRPSSTPRSLAAARDSEPRATECVKHFC